MQVYKSESIMGRNSSLLDFIQFSNIKLFLFRLHTHLILSVLATISIFIISFFRLSKTGTFVAFRAVDKSIHQKILCGETQSRKVMSAGKEQIKLALN